MNAAETAVTILMPCYNAARFLREAVESVRAQTFTGWVLLLLDDGSTDATPRLAASLAQADPRIVVVSLAHHGLCATLDEGLRLARTRWVARLDADDLWKPEHLERQVAFLAAHPEVRILGTWGERINERGQRISRMPVGPRSQQEYEALRQAGRPIHLIHSSVMACRDTLLEYGGYRAEDFPSEDVHLWNRVARDHPVLALPENLTSYRLTAGGICSSRFFLQSMQTERLAHTLRGRQPVELAAYRRALWRHPLSALPFLRRTLARFAFRKAGCLWFNGRRMRGASYLVLSLCLAPSTAGRRIWTKT